MFRKLSTSFFKNKRNFNQMHLLHKTRALRRFFLRPETAFQNRRGENSGRNSGEIVALARLIPDIDDFNVSRQRIE